MFPNTRNNYVRIRTFWKRVPPLALQPVEDSGLPLSPLVVRHLWKAVMAITFADVIAAALANWW